MGPLEETIIITPGLNTGSDFRFNALLAIVKLIAIEVDKLTRNQREGL